MEILIGLTILAVIVRVVIFFCAPELDETLSGFNSSRKSNINDCKYYRKEEYNDYSNSIDSENVSGFKMRSSNYSPNIGIDH